jgi:fructose-bisphosphate aldolase class II
VHGKLTRRPPRLDANFRQGVYKPGNVKLRPELLQKHQQHVKDQIKSKDDKPVFLVFHGGSGSSVDDFRQAISYGVVKVNLDTDMQWA